MTLYCLFICVCGITERPLIDPYKNDAYAHMCVATGVCGRWWAASSGQPLVGSATPPYIGRVVL